MGSSYSNYRDSLKKSSLRHMVKQQKRHEQMFHLDQRRMIGIVSWICGASKIIWYHYKEFIIKFILNYCLMDLLVYGIDLSFLNVGHVFEKQGKLGQKQYYPHF